jgi:FAD-dependent oxidoreductase domain-containing protein 1
MASKTIVRQALTGRSIAIVGGGPMGLATAVHLGRKGLGNKVMIIERDASYKYCSALLSAGGVRQQYSLPENIRMSIYSADFLMEYSRKQEADPNNTDHEHDIAFRPHGYMFLGETEDQKKILETNHQTQLSCGVDWIHLGTTEELSRLYPWLNTEGLALGSYSSKETGTKEGYYDPWGFMVSFTGLLLCLVFFLLCF